MFHFDSVQDKNLKKMSIYAGVSANLCLWAYWFNYLSEFKLGVLACVLGLVHFYFMEIDFRWVLAVRPYGYLPFFTVGLGLVGLYMQYYGF